MTESGRGLRDSVVLCNRVFLRRTTDSGPVSPPTTMEIVGRDAFFWKPLSPASDTRRAARQFVAFSSLRSSNSLSSEKVITHS